MLSAGMDYRQKNRARRLYQGGATPVQISQALMCELGVITRYLTHIGELEASSDSDQFGPLPGSTEWESLSRGARGGLTRKRQNAERNDNGNHSTVQP